MTRNPVDNHGPAAACTAAEQAVIRFPQGLPGFEELTRFFLCEREGLQPLTLLVALDTADVALPLLRCADFLTDYAPAIPMSDLEALEVKGIEELDLFVVVTFQEEDGGVAANLMAPICVNRTRWLGRQVVLPEGSYPLQFTLLPASE